MNQGLERFLGVKRWRGLGTAWNQASAAAIAPRRSFGLIAIAVVLASLPMAATWLAAYRNTIPAYVPTLVFGLCTVIALLLRRRLGFPPILSRFAVNRLSLTHTAVALGCVPAVLMLLISPRLLTERHEVLTETIVHAGAEAGQRPGFFAIAGFVLFISLWAAVTEEVLFRGFLLASIRRWSLFKKQRHADVVAIVVSATCFGLAHVPSWGWVPSIALVGLGCGFGIAYIVNDEDLFPLLLYHFGFDVLSISCALSL